jgi:hypothetical protein
MYKNLLLLTLLILSILIIILIISIIINQNKEFESDCNEIRDYKITNKKSVDLLDKFNIKEYDIINENIIIHNKFKNELLNSKKNKEQSYEKEYKDKEKKEKETYKKINENAKKIKLYELTKNYELTSNQVLSLKNNFKLDLNNFLNDKKYNKISKNEIKTIVKNLNIEIKNNLHKIKKINSNYSDIDNIELINKYENILLIKDDLLNKKKNIYIKFI